jgi:hypothetical protein
MSPTTTPPAFRQAVIIGIKVEARVLEQFFGLLGQTDTGRQDDDCEPD